MKIRVCDICQENEPDLKLKYKCHKKIKIHDGYGSVWMRAELCKVCLRKIMRTNEDEPIVVIGRKTLKKVNKNRLDLTKVSEVIYNILEEESPGDNDELCDLAIGLKLAVDSVCEDYASANSFVYEEGGVE